MDRIVASARRRNNNREMDPDYELLRKHFDYMAYMLQSNKLLELPGVDPVNLFLRNGAQARNTPDVNFSMEEYLRRYPEKAEGPERSPYLEWVKHGRDAGEIADPAPGLEMMAEVLGLPETELVKEISAIRTDLFQRLVHGTLGNMLAKAAEIDPLVSAIWPSATRPFIYPFVSQSLSALIAALYDCHRQAEFRRARVVLVVIGPRWGGGRRAEGHIAHALASVIGADEIVVVYTDHIGETPSGRFPEGVRVVDLARLADERQVHRRHRSRLLAELLRSFDAEAIVNVNSTLFYETLQPYSTALAATERVFHVMFCNDQGARGNWGGHPLKHFYRYIDTSAGIITDSWHLHDWLHHFYQLSDEHAGKVRVFSAPVDPSIPVVPAPATAVDRRPKVYWAGRLDRQKLPDVLFSIARALPGIDFHVWGESVAQKVERRNLPDNVILEGAYSDFRELDLRRVDAWLYTSAWDGVPSQLLEVGMTGVPIVGSLVGGTGEVLGTEAWAVAEVESAAAYVAALREVLADPAEARRRALVLRERLIKERSESAYVKQVAGMLLGEGRP